MLSAHAPRSLWRPHRIRAARDGLWVGAIITVFIKLAQLTVEFRPDAHAYWSLWRHSAVYSAAPEQWDAFLYSPAFGQAIWPLTLLPWPVFFVLWIGVITVIYAWLLAPLPLGWRIPLFLLCLSDLTSGNVWAFYALVAVAGFRLPAAWAFPLLTKVTPGVGVVWFAVRREWRALAIAVGSTAAIVFVSFALAPHLWAEWMRLLLHPATFHNPHREDLRPLMHFPAFVRLAIALPLSLGVTVYAARRNRPRLLPIAMVIAAPVANLAALGVLLAIPRIANPATRSGYAPQARPVRTRIAAAELR
jgi:hypothetical protein